MSIPLTVVVLTYNEERNLPAALQSVCGWAEQVWVVDSYSTDGTLNVAREFGVPALQNAWVDWAEQRNWALDTIPIVTDWVFFLDADEVATDPFRTAVRQCITDAPDQVAAFRIRQRFVFLGRALDHAHEAAPLVRVVRHNRVRWRCEGAREYATVDGEVQQVAVRLYHEDRRGLTAWIEKQNLNASREAQELLRGPLPAAARQGGQERTARRWLQRALWSKMPLFLRPFAYFLYIYVVRLGFLDGWQGFLFCFLHGLWFRMLIDAKYAEARLEMRTAGQGSADDNDKGVEVVSAR